MKKEGEIMARVLNRIDNVKIPPYIRREIGVSEDWMNNISPEQKKQVFKLTNRFKEALRKLSKN